MEVIGGVSAILEIATTGIQCSIKLAALAKQIRSASEQISNIADDVSLNASILQQLGQLMTENNSRNEKPPSTAKHSAPGLFSAEGLKTTESLAARCNKIFKSLEELLQKASKQFKLGSSANGMKLSRSEMLKWPFVKPELDGMRDELRHVKDSLMLMLQVALLAYSRSTANSDHRVSNIAPYAEEDQIILVRAIYQAQEELKEGKTNDNDKFRGELSERPPKASTQTNNVAPSKELAAASTDTKDPGLFHARGNQPAPKQPEKKKHSIFTPIQPNFQPDGFLPSAPPFPAPTTSRAVPTYDIQMLTPGPMLVNNVLAVKYIWRCVSVTQDAVRPQIKQQKSASKQTVLDLLCSLSSEEQQALELIPWLYGIDVEWITLGEYTPVIKGIEHIKARTVTLITRNGSAAPPPMPSQPGFGAAPPFSSAPLFQSGAGFGSVPAAGTSAPLFGSSGAAWGAPSSHRPRPRLTTHIPDSPGFSPASPRYSPVDEQPEPESRSGSVKLDDPQTEETITIIEAPAKSAETVTVQGDFDQDFFEENFDRDTFGNLRSYSEMEGVVDDLLTKYTTYQG